MKHFKANFTTVLLAGLLLAALELQGGVTNTIATNVSQSREMTCAGVMAERAELDKALKSVSGTSNSPEFKAARQIIVERNRQLEKSASDFLEQFPTNDSILIYQQIVFSRVLKGMLQARYSGQPGFLAEEIPSCLFETNMCGFSHISAEQAVQLQSAEESAFAEGVIAALTLAPESYNGVYIFLNRANPKAGQTLTQAILNDPAADDSLKSCASRVRHRKFGVGTPLSLKFIAVDGRSVDLAMMQGKVVLVEFWATGCVPCMAGLPGLELLYNKYHDRGFEVVGVSTDTDKEALQRVIQEKAIPWPVVMDPNGRDGNCVISCGVSGIPNYWLVDAKGMVRETMADFNGGDSKLEKKIELLLKERP